MTIRSFLFVFIIPLLTFSCKKDIPATHPNAKLEFSADTVLFDTVFTKIGSTTQRLLIYNNNSEPVNISQIKVAGGTTSQFQLTIDGLKTNHAENIELRANDSLYIMVGVTINPQNGIFIVKDSILFELNKNLQDIKLVAWGRDNYYHRREIIESDTLWPSDKVHLIYNYVFVDTNRTLTIEAGSAIYFHKSAVFYVGYGATLKVMGTCEDSVLFTGDRLEPYYKNSPSQWIGIRFLPGSMNNEINFGIIRNAWIGIEVDSVPLNNSTGLILRNTIIENMGTAGIVGYTSRILGFNLLVDNCADYLVAGDFGGRYYFYHSTFANYNFMFLRKNPSLVFTNNVYKTPDGVTLSDSLVVELVNCIIWGEQEDEFEVGVFPEGGPVNLSLFNNVIKLKTDTLPANTNNLQNIDPKFKNPRHYDYRLDSLSPVKYKGLNTLLPLINKDIKCKDYHDPPSPGCYEWDY